jgi:hypothetical protein
VGLDHAEFLTIGKVCLPQTVQRLGAESDLLALVGRAALQRFRDLIRIGGDQIDEQGRIDERLVLEILQTLSEPRNALAA